MRMKKIPVRMLAILLVCMTVLLSVCLELLSVPAMAAEEKAACYTVRIANLEHGSIALKEDDNLQAGNQIHLQVTPQEGYHLASLTVATSDGTALAVTDTDGAAVTDGAYPDTMLIVMPEDDVTVTGAFVSENDAADTAVSDTVLPEEIFSMTGADTPLAATMNSAERAISRAASSATLIKYENQFSCYHKDGSWDCTESYLMLGDQLAWCIEPSVNIGASGGTYGLNGDAAQWLMDKYGWSYKKTNNLTKAVYLAKSYYGNDWLCSYVLVQNLIWSEIKENESPANYGRYVLTDGARNTAHNCGHLNTKAKVDAAIADVWNRFYSYNKLPSFDGWTVYATAGQSYWLKDTNGVVNDTSFVGQTGVTVSKGWDGSNVGIWIGSDAIEAYDETQYGSITIYKKSANEKQIPLSGVSFRLVGVDEGDEHIASTDADGKICWEGLLPQDYVITEIKTADGKNLLKDNITVTLPMELTVEEAQQRGADLSQAVWDEAAQKYCFYDLTFEIGNSAVLTMPMTGGNTESMYVLMIVGILAAVGGIALLARNRKKNHVN